MGLVPSRTDGTICLDVDGVRGRAKRHAALAITSKTRFWYNI